MKEKKKDKNHGSPASPVDHILFSDRLRFGDLKYSSAYSLSIGSGTLNHTMFILRKIICALAATRLSAALELVEATTTSVSLPTASESPSEPPPASDSPYSPGSNSSIASISFSGNGCPQNGGGVGRFANYTGNLVDGQEIVYHNFTAVQQGAAFPPTGRTLNCQMHLSVTGGDMGWQVSPDVVSYGGFAVLDPESAVSFFVTTFWSQDASYTVGIGQFNSPPFSSHLSCPTTDANPPSQQKKKKQFTSQTTLSNPGDTRASRFVGTSVRSEVWSPCVTSDGGAVGIFNMNFRVSTVGGGGTGLAYFGPLELMGREVALVKEQITYKWRRCQR